jgi:hypothetical protein
VLLLSLGPAVAWGQTGIASRYLRDAGIESDPDVVFVEMFETGTTANLATRWTATDNTAGMSFVSNVPLQSGGARALQMTSVGGVNEGGQLYKTLAPGYEQLYFRYYVKYAPSQMYHHTGGYIGGYFPLTNFPQGGAGERPAGNDRFSIGPEPRDDSLRFDMYTYWMEMKVSPDGVNYWGNEFLGKDPNVRVIPNQWTCIEVMVKTNNPLTARNGELALWIDGTQVVHLRQGAPNGHWDFNVFDPDPADPSTFEGFRWRSDSRLNVNWIWLLYYVSGNPPGFVGQVWFDHVVVAKQYIGPINTTAAGPPVAPSNLTVN